MDSDGDEADIDDYWSVVLQLGGREIDAPPLPTQCAINMHELRRALAKLTAQHVGASATPKEWMDGELNTMRIQYLTMQVIDMPARP